MWSERPAWVRAPATSANLGPGFDALGLALGLYDVIEARVTAGGLSVEVTGEGAQTVRLDENHLVVRAMRAAFARMGADPPGIALRCVNAIPHQRGLGSSAAAVVSGLLAARALVNRGQALLPGPELLRLAADMEGHPDNVAACLLGGLTIAWRPASLAGAGRLPEAGVFDNRPPEAGISDTGGPPGGEWYAKALKVPVRDTLTALVCVPPTAVATHQARRLLPTTVPHADAAANVARTALLVAGITSDPTVLFDATEDFLHQPYRAALMPETVGLVSRLRRAGLAAVISGAGPSVLVLTVTGQQPGLEAVDSIAGETGIAWHVTPLDIDRCGATVQPGGLDTHPPASGRHGRSWHQAAGPGAPAVGDSPQGHPAFSAIHGPLSRECHGLLWC